MCVSVCVWLQSIQSSSSSPSSSSSSRSLGWPPPRVLLLPPPSPAPPLPYVPWLPLLNVSLSLLPPELASAKGVPALETGAVLRPSAVEEFWSSNSPSWGCAASSTLRRALHSACTITELSA